jgi:alkanesulfonate monooxygenase SsuD/methylene tetrahydromethanopterin reductase-like flavin-dependent oxidoreductase (luciferase family)
MLDLTGRLADGWLPMLMTPQDYCRRLATIAGARAGAGRDGDFTAALWSYVCYGESRDDCLELFESPMYKTFALLLPPSEYEAFGIPHPLGSAGLSGFVPTWLDEAEILAAAARVPVELVARCVLHGTVDDIAADLDALHHAGMQVAVLGNVSFLTNRSRVRMSYEAQRALVQRISGQPQSTELPGSESVDPPAGSPPAGEGSA